MALLARLLGNSVNHFSWHTMCCGYFGCFKYLYLHRDDCVLSVKSDRQHTELPVCISSHFSGCLQRARVLQMRFLADAFLGSGRPGPLLGVAWRSASFVCAFLLAAPPSPAAEGLCGGSGAALHCVLLRGSIGNAGREQGMDVCISGWMLGIISPLKERSAVAQPPRDVGSHNLGVFQSRGDVALWDEVGGHGWGWGSERCFPT